MDTTTAPAADRPTEASLLTLSGDLLRSIANLLPPTDRIALSQTSKALFAQTWSTFGLKEVLARFTFERRTTFTLSPALPGPTPLRAVPDRAAQQHVYAAISADGRLAAVLPYDNVLRVIDTCSRTVTYALPLPSPALSSDVWALEEGFRRPTTATDLGRRYREAIDPESSLDFSADASQVLLACARFAHVYPVLEGGTLGRALAIDAASVLRALYTLSPPHVAAQQSASALDSAGAAGAATLSPDGKTLAWVMFLGFPARAFLTLWKIDVPKQQAKWESYTPLGLLGNTSGSALAWVRATFHGHNCVAIALNSTRRMLRTERVGDTFRRVKLCRFRFFGVRIPRHHVEPSVGPTELPPAATSAAWLSLAPATYPSTLAAHLRKVVIASAPDGESEVPADKEGTTATSASGSVHAALNCVHTSPSEATYKALAFGARTRHPWFVAKQPLYSIHFCTPISRIPCALYQQQPLQPQRVLVASAAHDNTVCALEWVSKTAELPGPATPQVHNVGNVSDSDSDDGGSNGQGLPSQTSAFGGQFQELSTPGRRFAFRGLPWRAAFASVTSFAPGGRWIIGAALQGDDCVVCVRNVTDTEYYGEQR